MNINICNINIMQYIEETLEKLRETLEKIESRNCSN